MKAPALLLSAALLLGGMAPLHAQTATPRLRGEILALEGPLLRFQPAQGEPLTIQLGERTRILVESRVTLAAVVPGVFTGITSAAQADGSLRAVQIRIFPEAQRGTGEGHRLMDPQGRNTMTNATVGALSAPAQTMTNATITGLGAAGQTRSLRVRFGQEEKQILVPDDVIVIQAEIGERSQLVPGTRAVLSISQDADGKLSTERLTIGKDGSTPM